MRGTHCNTDRYRWPSDPGRVQSLDELEQCRRVLTSQPILWSSTLRSALPIAYLHSTHNQLRDQLILLILSVPDTRQPVRHQRERGHQQQQHGRTILRVTVDLPRHSHQPQQSRCLQQPDQRRRLQVTRSCKLLVCKVVAIEVT